MSKEPLWGAFGELLDRLSESFNSPDIARLLEKRKDLQQKIAELARKVGNKPGNARRLKRLQKKLAQVAQSISSKQEEPKPQLERLRRAIDADRKEGLSKSSESQTSKKGQSSKGKGDSGGEANPKGKPSRPSPNGGAEQASAKKSMQTGKKGTKTGEALSRMSKSMAAKKSSARVQQKVRKVVSRLKREVAARRASQRMKRISSSTSAKKSPSRLRRKNGSSGGASDSRSTGERGAQDGRPGNRHVQNERRKRNGKLSSVGYEDSVVGNEGKTGRVQTVKHKGVGSLGKNAPARNQIASPEDVDDKVIRAQIPSRYRETVRTYFKILPELELERSSQSSPSTTILGD